MKILLIGATGTIGKAIAAELAEHEVISVGNSRGDYRVDLNDAGSIAALFRRNRARWTR